MNCSVLRRSACALMLLGIVAGCGGRNPNAPATITGKVTYKGTPLPAGTINFYGENTFNSAVIGRDGSYTGNNFTVGEMTVTIETESLNPAQTTKPYPGQSKAGQDKASLMKGMPPPEGVNVAPAEYVKIPAKYADKTTSNLKVTIVPGSQKKDFELTD